ncbi:MAG: hypothetical protein R6U68_03470 [Desulfobacteraceae bacterium]
MKKKIKYLLENWKLIIHLFFKTNHFGVNNRFWSPHYSIFGAKRLKGVTQVVKNYKMMRIRAFSGFIPLNDAIDLFPDFAEKNNYRPVKNGLKNSDSRIDHDSRNKS